MKSTTLIFPLLALLAGCGADGALRLTSVSSTTVRIEASAARPQIAVGDTVTILVKVTNTSNDVVTERVGCTPLLMVLRDGVEVLPPDAACALVAIILQLGPGESYKVPVIWNARGHDNLPLPAGDYVIRPRFRSRLAGDVTGPDIALRIIPR